MTFGKNRVQFKEFLWTYYKFDDFDTYYYLNGKELAQFTAEYATQQLPLMESKMESYLDKKIQFIIFNNLTDLKQSNIGLITNETYNTGGITHIIGSKVFLYFDGNHVNFQEEIRAGKQAIIKAKIVLVDGSCLIIREYVDSKYGIEKLSYAYQYQDREGNLIFRYDNAAHKPKLEMAEHRHSLDGIVVADPPDMAELVDEVIGFL